MEIKFNQHPCRCMRTVTSQTVQREETQEVRLPDGMPDIGRILGCWGQVVIRGKEWRSGGMGINGGVMVWTLYAPEDGSQPRTLEDWIPFQQRWEFEDTERDGFICIVPRLVSLDARSTSARKLMLRAVVSTWGRAMESREERIMLPESVPEDVQVLHNVYPMELPLECGEKLLQIEEEPTLQENLPVPDQILRYEFLPQILEQKVMASRLVFRGVGNLHLLYRSAEKIHSWNTQIPFSQYTDLDRDYGSNATAQIIPVLTNLEVQMVDGRLALKVSMAAQYMIHDRVMVELLEDAYSPVRNVKLQYAELKLPVRLDRWSQSVKIGQILRGEIGNVVDVSCMADHPKRRQSGNETELSVGGQYQLLYYDHDGQLQSVLSRFEQPVQIPSDSENVVEGLVNLFATAQIAGIPEGIEISQEMLLDASVLGHQGIQMITGMEVGEATDPDPVRPSMILRRCDDCRLWDLAKESGSTVDAIKTANSLDGEPENGRMLLIPIS